MQDLPADLREQDWGHMSASDWWDIQGTGDHVLVPLEFMAPLVRR